MSNNAVTGAKGEQMAADYLQSVGYAILERNYRHKHAEIDLIASMDNLLVFVEVKARSSNRYGHPEEAVDGKKAQKIIEGAEHYIQEKDWHGNIRFDIVAVSLGSASEIRHFEDAFY